MYFLNKRTFCIYFHLFIEGKGILGEFTFINNSEIIIADKPKRLIIFNPLSIAENKEEQVDQNNSSIVIEDNNISGMNWGIAVKGNLITTLLSVIITPLVTPCLKVATLEVKS